MRFCPKCGQQCVENRSNIQTDDIPQYTLKTPSQPKKSHFWRNLFAFVGVLAILFFVYHYFIDPSVNYESNYIRGSGYYDSGEYEKAREYFLKVNEDYKNTHLYLILCQGHIYDYLTDEQFDELTNNLDFNDTKSLFLTEPIAAQFLDGYWTNDDGNKYLEFYKQGEYWNVHTNLDNSDTNWDNADSFYLSEGIFGLEFPIKKEKGKEGVFGLHSPKEGEDEEQGIETINPNDEFEKKELFRITILGKDKIAVVILKDNSRYVLTRDK